LQKDEGETAVKVSQDVRGGGLVGWVVIWVVNWLGVEPSKQKGRQREADAQTGQLP